MRQTYELINNRQATPRRLHALVRLVARLEHPNRATLADYLQPPVLVDNQSAFDVVYSAAINCELIQEVDGHISLDRSLPTGDDLESTTCFRRVMQERLLGVTDPDKDNYLLNLLAAWWAAQDAQIFDLNGKKEVEIQFNEQLSLKEGTADIETGRTINRTKLTHWLEWAAFLGWGWMYKGMLMPDARVRIQPCLAQMRGQELSFSAFIRELARACPELDGGLLFQQAWQAGHGGRPRGQRLSLMLTTALRVLDETGIIELIRHADAPDIWQLHEAEGYTLQEVSNIRIKG
jgi:hypothetical protein